MLKPTLLKGIEKIDYFNNSPDTLTRFFFIPIGMLFNPTVVWMHEAANWVKPYLGKNRQGTDVLDWDPRVKDQDIEFEAQ